MLKILEFSNKRKEDFQCLFKKPFLTRLSALTVAGFLLMFVRWRAMGSKPPIFQDVDNPASFAENLWTRVIIFAYYVLRINFHCTDLVNSCILGMDLQLFVQP